MTTKKITRPRFNQLDKNDPRYVFGMFKNLNYILVGEFHHSDITETRCKISIPKKKIIFTIES